MGVKYLWQVLDEVRQKVDIEHLRGKKLAVDVSAWFCQGDHSQHAAGLQYVRLSLRNIYFRLQVLLRHHVRVVIVFDGRPPALKQQTLKKRQELRNWVYGRTNQSQDSTDSTPTPKKRSKKDTSSHTPGTSHAADPHTSASHTLLTSTPKSRKHSLPKPSTPTLAPVLSVSDDSDADEPESESTGEVHMPKRVKECCEMLQCLGVPYVFAPGEAEAFCASLEEQGIVDGSISDDSDVFLFGGRVVYRNFSAENIKDGLVECYDMSDVESRLSLTREKLVAMALLIGCDYDNEGVRGVGREQCVQLLAKSPPRGTLKRMRDWRENDCDLQTLENWKDTTKKPTHCTNCNHIGARARHKSSGCTTCGFATSCTSSSTPCSCDWHQASSKYQEKACEVKIRRKVLDTKPSFPDNEIIQAYLEQTPAEQSITQSIQWVRPNFNKLKTFCSKLFSWSEELTVKKILPLLTAFDMMVIKYGIQTGEKKADTFPERILGQRTSKKRKVFDVEWKQIEGVPAKWMKCETPPSSVVTDGSSSDIVDLTGPGNAAESSQSETSTQGHLGVTQEYQSDMDMAFPWIVKFFNNERAPSKGKNKRVAIREQARGKQKKIDEIFTARKKLNFFDRAEPKLNNN